MILASLSWPTATVIAVAIATVGLIVAVGVWQTFAIVIRDDRQTQREQRHRQLKQ
jgi:Na+/glutamate symporter